MQRRNILFSAAAAALLSACGGGGDEETGKSLELPSESGLPNAPASSQQGRLITLAAAQIFESDAAAAEAAASLRDYFVARGVSDATLKTYRNLVAAIGLLNDEKLTTSLEIGDTDFVLTRAVELGIVNVRQAERVKSLAARTALQAKKGLVSRMLNIEPLMLGRNRPRTLAATLIMATVFAVEVAFLSEETALSAVHAKV